MRIGFGNGNFCPRNGNEHCVFINITFVIVIVHVYECQWLSTVHFIKRKEFALFHLPLIYSMNHLN